MLHRQAISVAAFGTTGRRNCHGVAITTNLMSIPKCAAETGAQTGLSSITIPVRGGIPPTTTEHSSPFREVPDVAEKIDWKNILHGASGGVHVITCEEHDLDDVVLTVPKGMMARVVRGQRCVSKERTLQEWAAALQFPSYFGNTWDAFEDCVNDLEWLDAGRIVVIVTRSDEMLLRSPKDFATLLDILVAAEKETSLRVAFHCNPGSADELRRRINKAHKHSSGR